VHPECGFIGFRLQCGFAFSSCESSGSTRLSHASLQNIKQDRSHPPWALPSQIAPFRKTVGVLTVRSSPVVSRMIFSSLLKTLNLFPQYFRISGMKFKPLSFPSWSSVAKISFSDRTSTSSPGWRFSESWADGTFRVEERFPKNLKDKIFRRNSSSPHPLMNHTYFFSRHHSRRKGMAVRGSGSVNGSMSEK